MCNHYRTEPVLDTIYEQSRNIVPRVTKRAVVETVPEHVYPKYPAAVILDAGGSAELDVLRWGVWPFDARDKPQYITNARSDGLLSKATWKQSAALRRCVIPATGYFEPGLGRICSRLQSEASFPGHIAPRLGTSREC
jgi:putative SOS response-associated peptidase YedK